MRWAPIGIRTMIRLNTPMVLGLSVSFLYSGIILFKLSPCMIDEKTKNGQVHKLSHEMVDQEGASYIDVNHAYRKVIDTGCPRFARMMHTERAGLGHRLTEVVFGMIIAEETNSTFLFDDRIWSQKGKHGSYSWLLDFLPLDQTELTLTDYDQFSVNGTETVAVSGGWETVISRSKEARYSCNVLFKVALTSCCSPPDLCWCTQTSSSVGAFDRVKWRMREAFSRSNFVPSQYLFEIGRIPKNQPIVTIVWYIRQGDIVLNANKEHFDRLASQISSVLSRSRKIPVHVFFLGENNILRNFPFLPDICQKYFDENCSYPRLNVQDTLYHMVESDILITSGSSFPAVAALLRTDGFILYEYPKEKFLGIYEVSDQGLIHRNGNIVAPSLQELEYRAQLLFNKKLKKIEK